jgi:NAD(P)-dependent dehydrogenase (short-subunit alcohol dehydrogenase family)
MESLFTDKAGFVTGAAGGIGKATAIAFAKEGAKVVIADLESSRREAEETVSIINQSGGVASFYPVNVVDGKNVKALVDYTVATYGSLDFAFNNAGIFTAGFTADVEEKDFDRILQVDIKGVWLCMKYAILYMKEHGGGAIVNASSESGLVGTALSSPYVAAKHAVIGLTKTAAGEYANMGIRINAVAPGAIETAMVVSLPKESQEMLLAPQPLYRFGKPEEVADAVLFLCSDRASFITGTTLSVDGGATSNANSYNAALSPGI